MVCGPFLVKNSGGKTKDGILINDVTVGIATDTDGPDASVKQSHVRVHNLQLTAMFLNWG